MFVHVLEAIIFLFIGYKIGIHAKIAWINTMMTRMEDKRTEVIELTNRVKKMNNEMLSNFSKIAHVASDTEGQWTDIDEFIMPMWME